MLRNVHRHGGNVYRESRLQGFPIEQLVDFSANINPLGPSPLALQAVRDNLDLIRHYPDPDCTELTEELARYLKVDPDLIVVGNGGAELIRLVTEIVAPCRCLIPSPTFSEYAVAVERAGGRVLRVPHAAVEAHWGDADMLFLCNPNNPTGRLLPKEDIHRILRRAELQGTKVVVDEAFIDFVEYPEAYTVRHDVSRIDNLVVVGSLTKFFAIPGLRAGYAVAQPELASRLRQAKQPWSVNCLSQVAAAASLRDEQYIALTRCYVAREREFLFSGLRKLADSLGFQVWPPSANFVLTTLSPTGMTAFELRRRLAAQGILIRDCSNFPFLGDYSFRVAVRTREENEKLLQELGRVLG